jgi:putative oxidoreductase
MWTKLLQLRARALALVDHVSFLGPALVRVVLAVVFIQSGYGKLTSLDKVTEFFTSLHIPAPHLNAIVAASTEFFGGIAILLGLLTRLAALPMAFTMVIAILTAKVKDAEDWTDYFGFSETAYLVMFIWLACAGPGKLSLDYLIGRALARRQPHDPTAESAPLQPAPAGSRG